MVNISKLYELARSSKASMRFTEFERLVEAFGFTLKRVRGSHRMYKHSRVPNLLNIQPRGSEAKSYQVQEFLDMVRDYELKADD